MNWADARMRAEVRMRREGGAAAWHGGAGWAHSHAHARDFGYDSPLHPGGGGGGTHGGGKGEERFMSNRQFLILTGGVVRFTSSLQRRGDARWLTSRACCLLLDSITVSASTQRNTKTSCTNSTSSELFLLSLHR